MSKHRKIDPVVVERSLGVVSKGGTFFNTRIYGDGFSARLSEAPSDPSRHAYNCQSDWLNYLAIAHRLAVPATRDWLGLPPDHGFAISSMQLALGPQPTKHGHAIATRLVAERNERGSPVAVRARLWARQSGILYRVETRFQLMPAALVGFVRRGRNFADFGLVSMNQLQPGLMPDGPGRLVFEPGESDRLVDGERVDHVPALVLIDRSIEAMARLHGMGDLRTFCASFTRYADPRRPIAIELDAGNELNLRQDGEEIARMRVVMDCNDKGLEAVW